MSDQSEAARPLAEKELTRWPAGCRLRYCPELTTPDVTVFLVVSPLGRNCGTVSVTEGGAVVTRQPAED